MSEETKTKMPRFVVMERSCGGSMMLEYHNEFYRELIPHVLMDIIETEDIILPLAKWLNKKLEQ